MTNTETEHLFRRNGASHIDQGKRVAIVQSNYIPWKGYFDMIASVDEFILFDDVQYTRRDWRNRNMIKTKTGLHWLTIPVQVKGNFSIAINEVTVADRKWAKTHWESLRHSYRSAPCFEVAEHDIAELYREAAELEHLSDINRLFIARICENLGVRTILSWSTDHTLAADLDKISVVEQFPTPLIWEDEGLRPKNDRIIRLCLAAGANVYLSGPAAKSYLREEYLARFGISLEWMTYQPYPEYSQLHGKFTHQVSVLDLLFNTGPDARRYFRKCSTLVHPEEQK